MTDKLEVTQDPPTLAFTVRGLLDDQALFI